MHFLKIAVYVHANTRLKQAVHAPWNARLPKHHLAASTKVLQLFYLFRYLSSISRSLRGAWLPFKNLILSSTTLFGDGYKKLLKRWSRPNCTTSGSAPAIYVSIILVTYSTLAVVIVTKWQLHKLSTTTISSWVSNKLAFLSKADHLRMCVFRYDRKSIVCSCHLDLDPNIAKSLVVDKHSSKKHHSQFSACSIRNLHSARFCCM